MYKIQKQNELRYKLNQDRQTDRQTDRLPFSFGEWHNLHLYCGLALYLESGLPFFPNLFSAFRVACVALLAWSKAEFSLGKRTVWGLLGLSLGVDIGMHSRFVADSCFTNLILDMNSSIFSSWHFRQASIVHFFFAPSLCSMRALICSQYIES